MATKNQYEHLVPIEIRHSRLFVAAVLNSKGNVLYYTDTLLSMFSETDPGGSLHYADIIFPDDIERLRDALTLCLIGKTVSSIDLRMQARSGEPIQHVLWECSPASEATGDEALVLCLGTRLPHTPIAVNLNPEGESEVINNLLRRNRDLEQFANIVAHNIRSPLANIMGLNRLLGLELSADDKATALRGINTSAEKLENVIRDLNDVLQIRKADTGPQDLIVLERVVQDIEQSISSMIAQRGAMITYEFTEAPTVKSVRSYIQSIFQNLITNAIKYAKPDDIPMLVIHSHMDNKGRIILRFSDNGIGIDLEKHGRNLFGLYKRFTDNVEGKGLGLYMVKTQVEQLGGTIDVESKPGTGTEFTIVLPQ